MSVTLDVPAVRFPSKETMNAYKLKSVPQTIVIAPGGTVEENIVGGLTDRQVEDLWALAKSGDGTSS